MAVFGMSAHWNLEITFLKIKFRKNFEPAILAEKFATVGVGYMS